MAERTKLTNSSDESEISNLFSGDLVFEIPYFQRPYKWKADKLRKLEEDIMAIVDGETDSHFFGAIIMHERRSNPSEPTVYEIIDGQQRLTTIFLYICASIKVLCRNKLHDEANALFQKYISLGRSTSLISNIKLHSCGEDRSQMNDVMADLTADLVLKEKLGSYAPRPLPYKDEKRGALIRNYRAAVRFIDSKYRDGGLETVRSIYNSLLSKVSVVQIDVWDPTNGPRIFDSLNSKQEPMTIGDLVRNDVFSRVASREPEDIEEVDRSLWQPFYRRFQIGEKNYFEQYFFPFALIKNNNVAKSGAFNDLKKRWSAMDNTADVLDDLKNFQDPFILLVGGQPEVKWDKAVESAVRRLRESGFPSSTYPFIMRLLAANRDEDISVSTTESILDVIERFLVRRAIVGFEPTGLHAVFKRLWEDCGEDISADKVSSVIKELPTVSWPTDFQVEEAVKHRALYKANIIRFFIREYDRSLGGDTPSDIPWIEHVLPQKKSPAWAAAFSDAEHKIMVDRVANLLPLSAKMNRELSNSAYTKKHPKFVEDAMFKSTRKFAAEFDDWNSDRLEERSETLAKWAVSRWPN